MRRLVTIGLLGLVWGGLLRGEEITPEHFAFAARYSRSHGGAALRVQQGGKVIFEDYAPGFSASTPHKIYSGTKSFIAAAAVLAEQEGLLTFDERASDTLIEWQHDRRRDITLNQLLSQTSGLATGEDIIYPARDQLAAAIRVKLIDPPGMRFHYGPAGYQAFGEILRRKLRPSGRTVEGYVRKRVLDPLDIDLAGWKRDDAGNPMIHTGMLLSAREWAKFGEWIKVRSGRQKEPDDERRLFSILFAGHAANPAYGLGFWLNAPEPHPLPQPIVDLQPAIDGDQIYPGGPRDLVAAIGADKQRLYIIPSLDLVIVRLGREAPFSDGDFLSRLLTGRPRPDAHTH